jgi:hypothetical protein
MFSLIQWTIIDYNSIEIADYPLVVLLINWMSQSMNSVGDGKYFYEKLVNGSSWV